MTIHIGITGTRKGWTFRQNVEVKRALWAENTRALRVFFHHGDCVGVDEQAHDAATDQGFITVSHPPSDPKFRAWCNADIIHHPRPYMTRNQDIPMAKSLVDYIFKWLGSKFMTAEEKKAIGIVSRDSSSTGPIPVTQQEVVSRATLSEEHKLAFENQADAPACHECGSIMVRSGSCYRCTNCGATSGCS